MYKLYCRLYQLAFRCAAYALPWRQPELIRLKDLSMVLERNGVTKALVVTDTGLVKLGLVNRVTEQLNGVGIAYTVYDRTVANPTVKNVEEAYSYFRKEHCNGIIALGGGSPMDCAKAVGARAARPNKSISRMRGQLKVLSSMPFFVAVPTTAGTGSETTLAAVITDSTTHEKYAVNDPSLIPHCAVLDPYMTKDLPSQITAETGMDALVHAVEAYIGGSNTKRTKKAALAATRLIFANLPAAYANGGDMKARENMQNAAYLAGLAFTRAYVGNIHAVAHTLGGQYRTPHGLANAVIMPYVLDAYGPCVYRPLAELAKAAGIADSGASDKKNAKKFIKAIRRMNRDMNIPDKIADLRKEEIPLLAGRALREANPLYPVPRIFNRRDMAEIFNKILVMA